MGAGLKRSVKAPHRNKEGIYVLDYQRLPFLYYLTFGSDLEVLSFSSLDLMNVNQRQYESCKPTGIRKGIPLTFVSDLFNSRSKKGDILPFGPSASPSNGDSGSV